MKKFYLKEGEGKAGPFDIADLGSRNITAETPILEEGQAEWTTAGKLDELKDLFTPVPPPLPTEEPLPTAAAPVAAVEPAVTSAAATVTTTVPVTPAPAAKVEKPKPAASGKKSTAGVSWLLTLLILGGAGYFVYQDIEKNKVPGAVKTLGVSDTATTTVSTTQSNTSTASTEDTAGATVTTTTDPTTVTTDPVTTTTATTTATMTTAQQTAAQKAAAQKAATKKAEDEKKKLTLEAQKKADAEKKKLEAAQAAAAAKEMNFRNRWPNYISFGSLNYSTKGDGIGAFDVPLYNGTDAMLDKVTVRIEYLKKKETKIYKTETITITNIPARTTVNGKAPESKKGEKVNVFITGITSKKLHFCFPVNNGNAADPYFCN